MKNALKGIVTIMLGTLLGFAATKGQTLYFRNQIIEEIKNNNSESDLDTAIKQLYDNYGIVIHKQLEGTLKYTFIRLDITQEYNEDFAAGLLEDAYYRLEQYSDKALSAIPKDWYLVGEANFKRDNEKYVGADAWVGRFGMVLAVTFFEENPYKYTNVLDHEFFHAITNNLWKREDYERYKEIEEDCGEISEYACTGIREELAEAWSGVRNGKYSDKGLYLLDEYGKEYLRFN